MMDDKQFEQRVTILVRIIESIRQSDWPVEDKQWAIGEIEERIRSLKAGRPPRRVHGTLNMGA